jgi:predicted ATPase
LLKKLDIDNFKSLCNFSIEFSPLSVLIGSNSVGKSSILHAISLISHFANGSIKEYLLKRNWHSTELKSKHYHASKRNITFSAQFSLNKSNLKWDFTLIPKKEEDTLTCVREKIIDLDTQKILLIRETKKMTWYDLTKDKMENFPEIQLIGSMLSLIDTDKEEERFPQLVELKRFVSGINSSELLSPEKMKRTSRYDATDLGIGGERLGAFLHSLDSNQRQLINKKIKECYPYLQSVITSKKSYGHVALQMTEKFNDIEPYSVNANYISDGLLRIIAIISLSALDESYTAILLDEIEDGINPGLAANLINYLIDMTEENQKQIFITTHSPIMLNYFDEESVIFLWRPQSGSVYAHKMFESPELREHLRYMNPGEVWLNLEQYEIEKLLSERKEITESH